MSKRAPPSVIVVAREHAGRTRIAAMLEEAGIVVTVDEGSDAVLAAAAGEAYDLAIVVEEAAGAGGAADLAAAIRARHPALELLLVADTTIPERRDDADAAPRRRFVGCVRDRLLRARTRTLDPAADEAEAVIAMAQIACLHRRREAARRSGEQLLAEALSREIGWLAGHHRGGDTVHG